MFHVEHYPTQNLTNMEYFFIAVFFLVAALLLRSELSSKKQEIKELKAVVDVYEKDLKSKADELSAIDFITNIPALDKAKSTRQKVYLSVVMNSIASQKGFIPNNEERIQRIFKAYENEASNGTNSRATNSREQPKGYDERVSGSTETAGNDRAESV